MEILAHSAAKVLLFCGLFLLAVRYVHTYPMPMTMQQQDFWSEISEAFGIADSELFYICTMITIDLVVAIVAYSILMKFLRRYRTQR
ncbi:hypothetical protein [Paraburkholderia sp.]|uniref:hypothetical protein n=1 Tax=Paraburkholderia sp. TaxID=1926495 RepID=UPI0025CFDEF0|nr:hypothetical protein [Paraburkholderia sp.]